MRLLRKTLGVTLLAIGLGWWGILLAPEVIRTRRVPTLKDYSENIKLAPGTVAVVLGLILRHGTGKPPPPKTPA